MNSNSIGSSSFTANATSARTAAPESSDTRRSGRWVLPPAKPSQPGAAAHGEHGLTDPAVADGAPNAPAAETRSRRSRVQETVRRWAAHLPVHRHRDPAGSAAAAQPQGHPAAPARPTAEAVHAAQMLRMGAYEPARLAPGYRLPEQRGQADVRSSSLQPVRQNAGADGASPAGNRPPEPVPPVRARR